MRLVRLLGMVLTILAAGLLLGPPAGAQPPFRLSNYVTDNAGVLTSSGRTAVTAAVDRLYADRRIRLWVVYVENFSGQSAGARRGLASWVTMTRFWPWPPPVANMPF